MSPEAGLKSVEHLCLMNPEKDLRSGLPPQSSTAGSPQQRALVRRWFRNWGSFGKNPFGGIGQLERGVAD